MLLPQMVRSCTAMQIKIVSFSGPLVALVLVKFPSLWPHAMLTCTGFPGIVTRFYLQSRPSYSHMRSSAYSYPKSDYRKAMDWVLGVRGCIALALYRSKF